MPLILLFTKEANLAYQGLPPRVKVIFDETARRIQTSPSMIKTTYQRFDGNYSIPLVDGYFTEICFYNGCIIINGIKKR